MNLRGRSSDERSAQATRLARGGVTGMAAAITLAGTLISAVGCASNSAQSERNVRFSSRTDFTPSQQAELANVTLNPEHTQGRFTLQGYQQLAEANNLPATWLAEAANAVAGNEARRAAGQAGFITAGANKVEQWAFADAVMHDAVRDHQVGQADAATIESVYDAKLQQMATNADAQERSFQAEAVHQQELLQVTLTQWQSQLHAMRAEAAAQFQQAQARHEQMTVNRTTFEEAGVADIDKMAQIVDLTEAQAIAKIRNLRQEAETVSQQSAARLQELDAQINTVGQQTEARTSALIQQAASLTDSSAATVAELRAQAQLHEENGVQHSYELDVQVAESMLASQQAEAEKLFQNAQAMKEQSAAEVQRLTADAVRFIEQSRVDYEDAIHSVSAFIEQGKAQIAFQRVQADRVEVEGRAGFIKAEAEARAAAIREQSEHQYHLSKAEFERLQAAAEAEAARVKADYFSKLAEQQRRGEVTMPGQANPAVQETQAGDDAPEFADAAKKPAVIEADRIAAFKAALAKSSQMRKAVDALEAEIFATADVRRTGFDTWFTQQIARHDEMLARAEAIDRTNQTEVARMIMQSEKLLNEATAQYEELLAIAQANKKDTFAAITALRAEANAVEKKAAAQLMQLQTQASVAQRNGESEVRSLSVIREATARRGDAKSANLLAQAASLEQSQRAVVAQMRQEIDAAEQILSSELAGMKQAAMSFIAIAEAQYNEGLTLANNFERITDAKATEIRAANHASTMIAQADVNFLRELHGSQELVAEAAVARAIADAEAQLKQFVAEDMIRRAAISSQNAIARAAANEQFAIAGANDLAIKSRFESRIAQTQSERNKAYAGQYLLAQQKQAQQLKSDALAAAFNEQSQAALAELAQRVQDFERTAQQNWEAALAMPAPLPGPDSVMSFEFEAFETLSKPLADVPVSFD